MIIMKKENFTINELKAIYKIVKYCEENAPESEEDIYNDYYDEYETPISRKVIESIIKKIAKHLPAKDVEEINKDFLRKKYHTFNNNVDENVYAALKKALSQLNSVEIEYFSTSSAEFNKRKVDVYYTSSKYTIGYCHLRKDMRKFRTSRIKSARLTNSKYKIPNGFDKNNY